MNQSQYYFLSIGTNLDAERNAVAIITALVSRFGRVLLYPFISTLPEKLDTRNHFLNAVAVVATSLSKQQLKQQLNQIETSLGRDRGDPNRSIKDRPADIDIISEACADIDATCVSAINESYITKVLDGSGDRVDLSEFGLMFSDVPATVDLDVTTGHIVIINNSENRFI